MFTDGEKTIYSIYYNKELPSKHTSFRNQLKLSIRRWQYQKHVQKDH